jgi:hypothetical protein
VTGKVRARDPVTNLPVGSWGNRLYWTMKLGLVLVGVGVVILVVFLVALNLAT